MARHRRRPRPPETALEVIVSRRLWGLTIAQITRMLRRRSYRQDDGRWWTADAVKQVLIDADLWQPPSPRVRVLRAGQRYPVWATRRWWSSHTWYAYVEPLPAAEGQTVGPCWICDSAGIRHPYYAAPVTIEVAWVDRPIPTIGTAPAARTPAGEPGQRRGGFHDNGPVREGPRGGIPTPERPWKETNARHRDA